MLEFEKVTLRVEYLKLMQAQVKLLLEGNCTVDVTVEATNDLTKEIFKLGGDIAKL